MKLNHCLYCYQPLPEDANDFHVTCSKKFFGTEIPPVIDYDGKHMYELATEIIKRSVAVTGVQPKLSMTIEKIPGDSKKTRFTIVGLWGDYILKPPTKEFKNLPENEDLTMHLAKIFGITVASHSLIRLKSGELAYITKRFDRLKGEKLAVEDMCQLTETMTINKYRSSMEKVGNCITKYSARPGLDAISFFETTIFCFLTGNADMHLKNFSLLTTSENQIVLSPAYDMLCTKIALPEDKDEIALTVNAKKRKLKRSDFNSLATNLKIPAKARENSYERIASKINEAINFIELSFLPVKIKEDYKSLVKTNVLKLEL